MDQMGKFELSFEIQIRHNMEWVVAVMVVIVMVVVTEVVVMVMGMVVVVMGVMVVVMVVVIVVMGVMVMVVVTEMVVMVVIGGSGDGGGGDDGDDGGGKCLAIRASSSHTALSLSYGSFSSLASMTQQTLTHHPVPTHVTSKTSYMLG